MMSRAVLLLFLLAMPLPAQTVASAPPVPWAGAPILTPPSGPGARLHGPKVFGVRPGSPFLYAIPATGIRPVAYSADGLPPGLVLDPETGRITGALPQAGTFPVVLHAKNAQGDDARPFKIVVGDDLCLTPAMGWNSWNCWAASVDAGKVRRAAQAMVSSGLAQHGWSYVNIDDSWQGQRGGAFNGLQANKKFPDMKALCDEIHGMGLKVGIYSTPWTTSFAGHAGSSADTPDGAWAGKQKWGKLGAVSFAVEDARQWAEWGIDYLKYDWHPNEIPEVKAMADALRASGRDIVLSISTTAPFRNAEGLSRLAQSWRTTGDIYDKWQYSTSAWAHSVPQIGFAQDPWAPFAGPGHWNDPDMLVLGWVGWGSSLHPTRLTADEQYTHVTLWVLLAAPLIMGGDMERLDPFTIGLLTNDEVIDIDQDALGKEATQVYHEGDLLVYERPLEDGARAVGFFNAGAQEGTYTVPWQKLGLEGRQAVRDVWRQSDLGVFPDGYTVRLPSHGSFLAKVAPAS